MVKLDHGKNKRIKKKSPENPNHLSIALQDAVFIEEIKDKVLPISKTSSTVSLMNFVADI